MVALAREISRDSQDAKSLLEARVSHGRGSNWIHPSLSVFRTKNCGYGVVAQEFIPAGTTVVVFAGIVITGDEFESLPHDLQHFPFQIADDLFLGPRDEHDIGIGERINHSCDPNVGFSGPINLVTIKDIQVGEEVTLDYATCVASDDGAFVMACACGAPSCRNTITGQDWRLPDVQHRLLPYLQPFIRERLQRERATAYGDQTRPSSNCDEPMLLRNRFSNIGRSVGRAVRGVCSFIVSAFRQEWLAIPICVIAGIPSTLITVLLMTSLEPWLQSTGWFADEIRFIAAFSLLSSIVGYATYIVLYYAGMLFKERADWLENRRILPGAFATKCRVIKYDFIAHLPSDLWVMPMIGAAQGGMLLAGASQVWSIVVAHTLSDIAYAIKEPLFWHGAKQLVAWRERASVENQ